MCSKSIITKLPRSWWVYLLYVYIVWLGYCMKYCNTQSMVGKERTLQMVGSKIFYFPTINMVLHLILLPCRGFYHIIKKKNFDWNHIIKLDQSITINGPKSRPFSYFIKIFFWDWFWGKVLALLKHSLWFFLN